MGSAGGRQRPELPGAFFSSSTSEQEQTPENHSFPPAGLPPSQVLDGPASVQLLHVFFVLARDPGSIGPWFLGAMGRGCSREPPPLACSLSAPPSLLAGFCPDACSDNSPTHHQDTSIFQTPFSSSVVRSGSLRSTDITPVAAAAAAWGMKAAAFQGRHYSPLSQRPL